MNTTTETGIRCGSCTGRHPLAGDVAYCYRVTTGTLTEDDLQWGSPSDQVAEQTAEAYAEAIASWCSSGGTYQDALKYAAVIAAGKTWPEYLREQDAAMGAEMQAAGLCEHGLSAALCDGPSHYPMDI
jgi:hypothetical protein